MSHKVIEDACIGCGGCEYACPEGALRKTDSYLGLFVINPLTCNDCDECVSKCPVFAIVVDPDWSECSGHGCPLSATRLSETECAFWKQRCADCGTTVWKMQGESDFACPKCGTGMKVTCPRTRRMDQITPTLRETFPEFFAGAGAVA